MRQLILKIVPPSLLQMYKKREHSKIIEQTTQEDEPEVFIAQRFCSKNKIVLDIGANVGLYTKFLSPCCKKIIAVEPISRSFKILEFIVKKFGLNNVELVKKAISDSKGVVKMYIPVINEKENLYRASLEQQHANIFEVEKVVKTTIDDEFLDIAGEINFIKCDVEGHELSCLLGAKKFLAKSKPVWLIEVTGNPDNENNSAFEVFRLMQGLGYRIYMNDGGKLRLRQQGDESINYFFIHRKTDKLPLEIKSEIDRIK